MSERCEECGKSTCNGDCELAEYDEFIKRAIEYWENFDWRAHDE